MHSRGPGGSKRTLWRRAPFTARFGALLGVLGVLLTVVPVIVNTGDARSAAIQRVGDRAAVAAGLIAAQAQSMAGYARAGAVHVEPALIADDAKGVRAVLSGDAAANDVIIAVVRAGAVTALEGPQGQAGDTERTALLRAAAQGLGVVAERDRALAVGQAAVPGGTGATLVVARSLDARFVQDAAKITAPNDDGGLLIVYQSVVVADGVLCGVRVHSQGSVPDGALPVVDQPGTTVVSNLGGGTVAVASRSLGPGSPIVVVGAPAGDIVATLAGGVMAPVLLILGALLLLAYFVERDLQGPLRRLDRAVTALRREDFDAPVPMGTDDAIGRLGTSFDAMRRELRATLHGAEARAQIASELNAPQPLDHQLEAVCLQLCGTIGARSAFVLVTIEELGDPFVTSVGPLFDVPAGRLAASEGLVGAARDLGEGRLSLVAGAASGSVEREMGVRDMCVAPIRMGATTLGVVGVCNPRAQDGFNPSDVGLIESAAGQLALGLERYRFLASVQEQASTDELTGLRNYRFLVDSLDQQVALAERQHTSLAVLMLDLDHFKTLNDAHGHHCGDVALRAFADTVRTSVRRSDLAARYGGEEFAVVMPSATAAEAAAVAEKIRSAVEDLRLAGAGGAVVRFTVSIGAVAYPEHTDSAAALLQLADAALYRSKRGGRNRVSMGAVITSATGPRARRRPAR